MPQVAAALDGKLGTVEDATRAALPRWFDPAAMSIAEADLDADVNDHRSGLLTGADRPQTARRIADAFSVIASIAEVPLLRRVPMPTFLVAKSRSAKDANVRASTESQGVTITVDQNSKLPVLVHEFGHVVENFAPLGLWLDIQWLLHGRKTADVLIPIPHLPDEPCYQAVMPAYPHYSAKVYGGWGATEVVSTTLELLSTAPTAGTLIDKDPQVAAIVLRWLAPGSFVQHVPAGLHTALLPSPYRVG